MGATPLESSTDADLLSRAAAAPLSNDPALMQNLALACHARMLELAESDRPQAVRLALAGATLLSKVVALGGDLPETIALYEEQCCRYGCIWLHDLLQDGNPPEGVGADDALALLARMEALHPEPVDWAPVLRASLLSHQAAPAPTPAPTPAPASEQRIVVVGNCQCHPLMLSLRQALPQAPIHFCPSVHLATPEDVNKLHSRLRSADLLVVHRIQPGYRNGLGLDTASLRALLPATARTLVLPNLHYEGHHPFISYAQDPDGRLAALEGDSPLGSYHDFLAMAAADQGIGADALLQDPGAALITHIQQWHRQSIQELAVREQDCDIAMSDWIEHNHRQQPLMHTINHPTQHCLDQILRRLLQRLDPQLPLRAEPHDRQEHLGEISIPIHPWVRQALDLAPWAHSWGQRRGEPFPIAQQLAASIEFYQRHPWSIENNRQHPRFELVQQLLSSTKASVPAPRRQPSLAALINHYDDVEMLAWQLRSGGLDPYDRIYIWDGPYQFRHQLGLGEAAAPALAETAIGQQLLADPRVVYRQGSWQDEAEKRMEAYAAITEDLIVLHDTDEFFRLDPDVIDQFWNSGYGVGSHRIQNLYAGGLLGSDRHHRSSSPNTLPHRRFIFRRDRINAAQHLDYLWLVGVAQNPADASSVCPQALGDTLHLTGCRNTRGQIGKMSFYKCLALRQQATEPVLLTLRQRIEAGDLTADDALLLYLRGDPGFAGIPHPDFGLSLQPRFPDPRFPNDLLEPILADSHLVNVGTFPMLEGYPLVLWFPSTAEPRPLRFALEQPGRLMLRSWLWRNQQPAQASPSIEATTDALQLTLPAAPDLMGSLVEIRIQPTSAPPRCQVLRVDER